MFTHEQTSDTFWLLTVCFCPFSTPGLIFPLQILCPQGLTQVSPYVWDCAWSLQHRVISPSGTLSMALNCIFFVWLFLLQPSCYAYGMACSEYTVYGAQWKDGKYKGRTKSRRKDKKEKNLMYCVKLSLNFHLLV